MNSTADVTKLDFTTRFARWLPLRAATSEALGRTSDNQSSVEAELLARLRAADPEAIDQLYRAHHEMLRAFAQRLVGEREAAEDLVHDVFVSLPGLMRRFRGQSSLRTFLVGVAANLASRHIRSASRRRVALARYVEDGSPPAGGPEREQARRERAHALYGALDALSLEQRTAFVLCEVEERTAQEAAEILGVPEGTVKTRCFHARKRLAERLHNLGREEVP